MAMPASDIEFIGRLDALHMLQTVGDYTPAQSGIILSHARCWQAPGCVKLYERAYIEMRARGEFRKG